MSKRNVCLLLLGVLTTSLWASTYRPATIESVQREPRTKTDTILQNTVLDSTIVTKTQLVYIFKVRCGDDVYLSEYVYSGKPQNAPKNWKTQVQIRTQGSRMFIKGDNADELETRIVKH